MIDFELFRLKVTRPHPSLFDTGRRPQDLLRQIVNSRPTGQLRRGHDWHLGNLEELDASAYYFALGRTTRSTISQFDETRGAFVESAFESAPYTHVILDVELEVCAIARKYQLAPTASGIARQLARLLNMSPVVAETQVRVEIGEISDPQEFIALIRAAWAVRRFGMTFSLPNPWDPNEDFQKPLEETLAALSGASGKVTMNGEQLDAAKLEELARSAAATGNDAEATLVQAEGGPQIRRSLHQRVAIITTERLDDEAQKVSLLQRLRAAYRRIRQHPDNG